MSAFDAVDLANLPAPDVVEELDFEATLAALLADLRDRHPEFDALVESDPGIKLLEVAAYREMLLRQRVNDAARAVMLPHAAGADLDNLAALFSVARELLDEGDPDAVPPVPPTYETDARLRRRVQLALEAATAAGTRGRYLFHALGADADIADAAVEAHEPGPGDVTISLLSASDPGWAAPPALIAKADAIVQADDVRQLCDTVFVQAAEVIDYAIEATITYRDGAGAEAAEALAQANIDALIARRRLGRDITRSGVFAALHVEGVHNVDLTSPAMDVIVARAQAARCTGVALTNGGVGG